MYLWVHPCAYVHFSCLCFCTCDLFTYACCCASYVHVCACMFILYAHTPLVFVCNCEILWAHPCTYGCIFVHMYISAVSVFVLVDLFTYACCCASYVHVCAHVCSYCMLTRHWCLYATVKSYGHTHVPMGASLCICALVSLSVL